jgi:4-amino-4-deoxy-L-arabinose transferase-like glycosyltransferase
MSQAAFEETGVRVGRGAWLVLGVMILLAVAVRIMLGIGVTADRAPLPDEVEYVALAESLLAGEGLVLVDDRYLAPLPLLAQRMPGYPLFVAAHGANVPAVRVTQALLDGLTMLATFGIGLRLFDRRVGLLAAGAVGASPFLAGFSGLMLSETLFTFLLAGGVLGLVMGTRRPVHGVWGLVLLAVSVYVRPVGAGLAVLLAMAGARLPRDRATRWPIPPGMTAALLVLLLLVPWIVRNNGEDVLGTPVPTTTNLGITLYDGWNRDNLTGASDQSFVARMPQLGLMGELERSTYLSRLAWDAIREDPTRAASLAGRKLLRTWSPVPLSESAAWARAVSLAWSLPIFALAAVGLFFGKGVPGGKVLLVTALVALTLAAVLTVGSLRYRVPGDPFLCVLAAAGLMAVWRRRANPPAEPTLK